MDDLVDQIKSDSTTMRVFQANTSNDSMRQDFFDQLSEIHGLNVNLDDKPLCDLALFGHSKNNVITNKIILKGKISFIKSINGIKEKY